MAAVLAVAGTATPVAAADPPTIVVEDGVTQPVFGYADAIRERVFIPTDFDSEGNGVNDVIAVDIIRPLATEDGLKVPVIMDASPYYTTVCRGNEGECIVDADNDGVIEKFPLFYDNYFVPRGYAIMLMHMAGTGASTGCPTTGGNADNFSAPAAIDWLNGRRAGYDKNGNAVVADWHNGKSGMIGKSYDGTLANAAAALNVDGLATIVPISAISNWYHYTRLAGLRLNGWSTNYPSSLSNTVTNSVAIAPSTTTRAYCSAFRTGLNAIDGDENGDFTPFWFERDYLHLLDNVDVPVFVIHGLQDDNVKTNNFADWWEGLQERGVPRKLWLTRTGHEDPFDFRRAVWVDTLHRWFDRWLQDVDNDVMQEPTATIEDMDGDHFVDEAKWPIQGTVPTRLFFRPGTDTGPGGFGLTRLQGKPRTGTILDNTQQSENTIISNLSAVSANRLVFLSEPLTAPVRISGTPTIQLGASADQADTDFGAALVDFGPLTTHVSRSSDGVSNSNPPTQSCWGESTAADDACYIDTVKNLTTATTWRVARGSVDGLNLYDYTTPTPLVPGQEYDFSFELYPTDYTFEVGHQIAVVVVSSYGTLTCSSTSPTSCTASNTSRPTITLNINNSRVTLPIVGGQGAAAAAGIQ
jgi:X-Pro dipeptidyl-peptidase